VSDRLAGKRVLVTGAAQGVGAVLARRCAEQGAVVVLADVKDAAGESTAAAIGGRFLHLDITDAAQWVTAMGFMVDTFGGIDGLVNNAAVLHMGPIETTAVDVVRRVLEVNVLGTYLGVQAAIVPMRAAGGGSIVNIGSIDGNGGMNAVAAYSASKWGVRGLTRSAAIELGRDNIRVNAVQPSMGNRDMSARYMRHAPQPKLYRGGVPVVVTEEDSAPIVVYLLADESAACTGGDYMVDAGWTAGPFCPGLPGF
jgi:3alpha(or 20beta)-hydroxysteroid dehydrogenase